MPEFLIVRIVPDVLVPVLDEFRIALVIVKWKQKIESEERTKYVEAIMGECSLEIAISLVSNLDFSNFEISNASTVTSLGLWNYVN